MKFNKFRSEKAVNKDGWSRWVAPKPSKYMIECCDCSSVHEMQFRVLVHPDQKRIQIQFRCRRANGYTKRNRARRGLTISTGKMRAQ